MASLFAVAAAFPHLTTCGRPLVASLWMMTVTVVSGQTFSDQGSGEPVASKFPPPPSPSPPHYYAFPPYVRSLPPPPPPPRPRPPPRALPPRQGNDPTRNMALGAGLIVIVAILSALRYWHYKRVIQYMDDADVELNADGEAMEVGEGGNVANKERGVELVTVSSTSERPVRTRLASDDEIRA